jgi:multidrug resistance efflux pump
VTDGKARIADLERAATAEITLLESKLNSASAIVTATRDAISRMTVLAPRAGTVVYTMSWRGEKKKVGDGAWRMEIILQVVSLDKMIGRGDVDEVDIRRVATGQVVTLRLDALPDAQLRGKVEVIARSVHARSNADPSKVVELKITLDPTKAPLRPGMRFRGEVETERVTDVVLIPADAVFVTPEGAVAYRDNGSGVEKVKLELGKRSATMIQVKSGLAPGDRVSRDDPERRAK